MALCVAGREIYTKCYQYNHFHLTQSFRPATLSGHLQSDEIPDSKITHLYTAANQVRAPDTALQSVVEGMKTIL